MSTLQKIIIAAAIGAAVGTGVYEWHRARQAGAEAQTVRGEAGPLAIEVQRLRRERDDATNRLAALVEENGRLKSSQSHSELLKLRDELSRLREADRGAAKLHEAGLAPDDPSLQRFLEMHEKAQRIAGYFDKMPEKKIPELKLLTDVDWLAETRDVAYLDDGEIRRIFRRLRDLGKKRLRMDRALLDFTRDNQGRLPDDISELKPYVKAAIENPTVDDATIDAILKRYELLHTGRLEDLPKYSWIVEERAPPADPEYDSHAQFGAGSYSIRGIQPSAASTSNAGGSR
jgi:hypothetical protein